MTISANQNTVYTLFLSDLYWASLKGFLQIIKLNTLFPLSHYFFSRIKILLSTSVQEIREIYITQNYCIYGILTIYANVC